MPERELANTESKPEIENWLEDVYKALQWQAPLSADVQNGDVIHDKLSSAELKAEAEAQQEPEVSEDPRDDPAYLAEKNALLARLKKVNYAKLAEQKRGPFVKGSTYENEYYDAFKLLRDRYDEAKTTSQGRDEQGLMDLKATQAAIEHAEQAGDAALAAYTKAKNDADQQLQSYHDTSKNLQKTLQMFESKRPALDAWGIDLKSFDDAYDATMDTLTALNSALAGSDLKAGIQAKAQRDADLKNLAAAHEQVALAADARKDELSKLLSSVESNVVSLAKKQHSLQKAPEHLTQFQQAHDLATGSLTQAQKDLDAGQGTAARNAIDDASKQHLVMQQAWVQGRAHAAAHADNPKSDDSKVELGKLSAQLEKQYSLVTDLLQHADFIERCSATPDVFETSKQLASNLMSEAQSGLVDGNKHIAQRNLQALKDVHQQMDTALKEARANYDICASDIEAVQKDLDFHYRGRDVVARYERVKKPKNPKSLKKFDEDYEKALNVMDRAEFLLENETIKAARESLTLARRYIKSLKDSVNLFQIALKSTPISGSEDLQFKIEGAIRDLRGELSEFDSLRSIFKDKEERDFFDMWHKKVVDYLTNAEVALGKQEFDQADDLSENAEIAMQALRDSYARGVETASKIEGYLLEAQAGKQKATSLYEQHLSIEEDDKLSNFLKHHAIALDSAKQAELCLRRGDTQEGRTLLATMNDALGVMDQCLIPAQKPEEPQKRRKLKDLFKRKPKSDDQSRGKKRK